ncbi:MAG: serine/threonine protein kinase [Proteobacteria bacterium]|nr:MAG: serine/threonine protein kinase [Pseudomonadota bacterium]
MVESAWGSRETQFFYSLTPDKVLDAVEHSLGMRCTGRSMAHASMENRVYEIELENENDEGKKARSIENQVIAKFYRPGRWSKEQILEEHSYLKALDAQEIPVVAPRVFTDGETLHQLADSGIYYAIFPKVAGRSPQEISLTEIEQIGRLLGRMHNVGAQIKASHRIRLTPEVYLKENFAYLMRENLIPENLRKGFSEMVDRLYAVAVERFKNADQILIHGDCHMGNLLQFGTHFSWVDFDDSLIGPAVQDLWLLLPGRDLYAQRMMDHLIEAYEQMRPFPKETLNLIEVLRSFRMIHFAAWIGNRRDDPAFLRAFPNYGTESYWRELLGDLVDQEEWIHKPGLWSY